MPRQKSIKTKILDMALKHGFTITKGEHVYSGYKFMDLEKKDPEGNVTLKLQYTDLTDVNVYIRTRELNGWKTENICHNFTEEDLPILEKLLS